ncbi:MAG: TolC family protein, partial [Candidatus Delongbacteria bacterium]|nr:TolC family protein [Candidatus Delongbacteria bacterium]
MIKLILILLLPLSFISALPVEEYIRIALENNPSLKTAYFKHQSQLEHSSASGYLPDPMLSAGYSISPIETRLGAQEWRISARQDLPWNVIFGDDDKIADYTARSSMADYGNMKEKVIFEVTQNYYLVRFKKKEISLTNEMLENYRSLLRIKDMNNVVSETSMSSNIMFGNKIDLMDENILQLTNDLSLLHIKFNLLLNRNTDEPVETDEPLLIDDAGMDSSVESLSQNLKLRSLDLQIEIMKYEIVAQERKRYPSFSLGVDYLFVNE